MILKIGDSVPLSFVEGEARSAPHSRGGARIHRAPEARKASLPSLVVFRVAPVFSVVLAMTAFVGGPGQKCGLFFLLEEPR